MEVAVCTLNLDSLPTRPICTPGSLINKFFCFDSTVVLTIPPRVTHIAPARQHINSTCAGGNASIVSYPPADATTYLTIYSNTLPTFKALTKYSRLLPNTPGSYPISLGLIKYSWLLPNTSDSYQVLSALTYSRLLPNTLVSYEVLSNLTKYCRFL